MIDWIKEKLQKIKSPKLLMIIGIVGIALIGVSSLIPSKQSQTKDSNTSFSAEDYRKELEENISSLVESITGSKAVKVVITLESGIKYTYADISEGISNDKTESDSKSSSSELKQSYITVKNADGGEQALLLTVEMPEVRGVAIVCEGGDDEYISEKIENAVTAALNITSKRVSIAGGNFNEKR